MNWIALIALMFVTACSGNEAGLACDSDTDCPTSYYCARAGGVLFASSTCVKRSDVTTADTDPPSNHDIQDFDTQSLDGSDLTPDVDPDSDATTDAGSDTNPDLIPDTEASPECSTDSDCDDGISCTLDTCINGTCQHDPDDSMCDDGNTCTDNTCDPIEGCVATNNNAPCDDGIFCNGNDLCSNGSCTFHSGSPCDDACNESRQDCSECAAHGDCGQKTKTAIGSCVPDTQCSASGLQEFLIITPQCTNGSCTFSEDHVHEPCSRDMPNGSCGQTKESLWSACAATSSNACALQGEQTRTITTYTCNNQQCKESKNEESRPCTLTPPTRCAPDKQKWSVCFNPNQCANSGMQSKSITTHTCNNGQCVPATLHDVETRSCERNTDGLFCTQGSYTGTCINNCCDVDCPPGGPHCLQCITM